MKVENVSLQLQSTIDKIINLDLSPIKFKLEKDENGNNWNSYQCEIAENQYKRFLILNLIYPKKAIVPDDVIDTFWHYHILDTRKYHLDCEKIFGKYFHHYPYYGMRGEADKRNLLNSFEETKNLFIKHFQIDMLAESSSCNSDNDSSDCRNCISNLK